VLGFEYLGDLSQSHIRFCLDRIHHRLVVLLDMPGALIAAEPLGFGRTARSIP
jgi:hypothetical protein